MTDHNHITATAHDKLFDALIGDDYDWDDWDATAGQTPRQEADALAEAAACAGITMSAEAHEALVGLVADERDAIDSEVAS